MKSKKHQFTDTEIRETWQAWGGNFQDGIASIPESNFLKLMHVIPRNEIPSPVGEQER